MRWAEQLLAIAELGVIVSVVTLACSVVKLYIALEKLTERGGDDESSRK